MKLLSHSRAKELNQYPYMKTKRGRNVSGHRSNKTAIGLTKTITDQGGKIKKDDIRTLSVYGTLDKLGRGNWLLIKKITISHPTDFGYAKEVYVLSESGKSKLKALRQKRKDFIKS